MEGVFIVFWKDNGGLIDELEKKKKINVDKEREFKSFLRKMKKTIANRSAYNVI